MSAWRQRRFRVDVLERTSTLYAEVEARRWEARTMNEDDRKLLCECWVAEARKLPAPGSVPMISKCANGFSGS